MPTAGKCVAAGTLTSTLTTAWYTVPSGKGFRMTHLVIANGSTAGTVTVSITYNSLPGTPTVELLYGCPIAANTTQYEVFDLFFVTGDVIKAGATTTGVCKIHIHGVEETPE